MGGNIKCWGYKVRRVFRDYDIEDLLWRAGFISSDYVNAAMTKVER